MSKFKKILSFLLCFILLLGCLTGCKEDYTKAIIYFELLQKPQTLDPQTAQSDSELLIVKNIFEGLMRENADGKIVCGASSEYSYSNLTYTFTIRDNAKWSNGEKVTAYDFEYAFRRAVDPNIKAPFASRLFAIENAEKIAKGEAKTSTLGVTALDKKTLKIKLCREDENFLKTLTTSVCMPCNEEFFEDSVGKYGLDVECIISNGSYQLKKWNKEDFGIRLYKNEKYKGEFTAQNAAVFISCIEDEDQTPRLSGGESDMAFVLGNELNAANSTGLITNTVENTCWVMTVSRDFSPEIRKAFSLAFSTDLYKDSLSNGFSVSKSIFPSILQINADSIGVEPYNLTEAQALMSAAVVALPDKKFPQATLYYYNVDGAKDIATSIVGHWQQNLSTFINIEASDNLYELQNELNDSTLQFALFPITAKSIDFHEYSKIFESFSTNENPAEFQKETLKENVIIPVVYQTTNVSYISSLENVTVSSDNGYIDFSGIIKR